MQPLIDRYHLRRDHVAHRESLASWRAYDQFEWDWAATMIAFGFQPIWTDLANFQGQGVLLAGETGFIMTYYDGGVFLRMYSSRDDYFKKMARGAHRTR